MQGLQGTQGLGNQGIQGQQGLQGLQGIQGLKGDQGTQGLGNQGIQGTQGQQGLQGLQSTQGSQGIQGVSGLISGSANQIIYKNDSNVATGNTNFLFINNSTLIVGAATSTGTPSQPFQVTGGGYVSDNLGIGTTNPISKLHVIGDVNVSGMVTAGDFNSTSDIRLKTNIKPFENALSKVDFINGVTFDWKENNKSSAGIIAQDVEKVFPELVSQTEIKTVNYNGLIGVLIEAIKELKSEVSDLKCKINSI